MSNHHTGANDSGNVDDDPGSDHRRTHHNVDIDRYLNCVAYFNRDSNANRDVVTFRDRDCNGDRRAL